MNENETEQTANKWAEAFERAIDRMTTRLPSARVVERPEQPPAQPATLDECRQLDDLCGQDFYEISKRGKPINVKTRFRLVSWHPRFGGSVEATGGAFT